MRARTVSAIEENETATLLTCIVEQQMSCGRVDGLVGEFVGGVTPEWDELIDVCFRNGKRSQLIPPLLLLGSTKNVNVLALSREQG